MNILASLLLTCIMAQVQDISPPVIPPPKIIWAEPEYEIIHNEEPILSKKYVTAILSNGVKITVPVINGYLPSVKIGKTASGATVRHFYYHNKYKYDGSAIIKYEEEKNIEVVPKPDPINRLQNRVEKLENSFKDLNKSVDAIKDTLNRQSPEKTKIPDKPTKQNSSNSIMKKPSEFDQ